MVITETQLSMLNHIPEQITGWFALIVQGKVHFREEWAVSNASDWMDEKVGKCNHDWRKEQMIADYKVIKLLEGPGSRLEVI